MSRSRKRAILDRLTGTLRLTRALRLVWEGSPQMTVVSLVLVVLRSLLPLAVLYHAGL